MKIDVAILGGVWHYGFVVSGQNKQIKHYEDYR